MKIVAFAVALMLALPVAAADPIEEPHKTEEEKREAQKKIEEAKKKAKKAEKEAQKANREVSDLNEEAEEARKVKEEPTEKVTLELGDVDAPTVDALVEKIDQLKEAGKTKELWIRIHSFGGEVEAGNKLIDSLENAGMKTVCVADHQAMSMGFYVLQACERRLMTKRSTLMIHDPSGGARGNSAQLKMYSDWLGKLNLAMLEMASKRMGMSIKDIQDKVGCTAWFLNWEEALATHAVDDTIDARDIPPTTKVQPKVNPFLFLFGKGNPNESIYRGTTDSN